MTHSPPSPRPGSPLLKAAGRFFRAGSHRYFLVIFLVLALFTPAAGHALESISIGEPTPKPVLSWDTETGKSYLIPALEIPTFILLLNGLE